MAEVLFPWEVMDLREFYRWRDTVVEQVRFRPDRAAVAKELTAHYVDHVKDLERLGYEQELAEQRALGAMGDPVEIGKSMDRVHQPWLGWLWLVSKWAAILGLVVVLLMGFSGSGWQQSFRKPAQRSGDYEPDGYFFFSEGWERDNAVRVLVGKGTSTVERDGDTFSVPYAAVWKCLYPADSENNDQAYDLYWMTVVLAADDTNPFDTRLGNFVGSLVLTCDDGRLYTSDYRRIGTDENGNSIWGPGNGYFRGNQISSDPFRNLYYMWQCAEISPGEWCELSYPNGEPWSIRIEWEEVEP